MRSDPLKNITEPSGPTPQSGHYVDLRAERKNTTTELLIRRGYAKLHAVGSLLLALLAGFAGFTQFRSGVLTNREQGLWILVVSVFLLWALLNFAQSGWLKRGRSNAYDEHAP